MADVKTKEESLIIYATECTTMPEHLWEWDPDDLCESCCLAQQMVAEICGLT